MNCIQPHVRTTVLPIWPLFLGILLGFCVNGCRKKTPSSSPVAERQTGTSLDVNRPTDRHIVLPQLLLKRQDVVPPANEWKTEELNELASEQLKRLGHWLVRDTASQVDGVSAPDAVSNSLFDKAAAVAYQQDGIAVRRVAEHDATRNYELAAELARLQQACVWKQFKFKVIRVKPRTGTAFDTEVLFHVSGQDASESERVELNATWAMSWSLSSAGKPILQSVGSRSFELTSWQAPTLFRDVTGNVLGGTAVYETCIRPSIASLRERMEKRLGVYNLGHHGIAIGDVNGDGLPDAYVCQTGGVPNHLFLQNADGTVEEVAAQFSVDYLDNSRAALLIDLDNDGDQDLVLTLSTGMLMLENTDSGTFRERARLRSVEQGFSLAAADFNNDGWLDVYVCVYYGEGAMVSELPVPVPYFDATNGGSNHLILNEGDWEFRSGTKEAGLDEDNHRFSFASSWDDFDNDGDQDLLVVNDFGPNQLFRNTNGEFQDCAAEVGLIDGAFGMSASFGDFNRDGQSDIYVANMFSAAGNRITTQDQFKPGLDEDIRGKFLHLARGNSLFASRGDRFSDVSVESGVTVGRWSWGALFADVNNDGWEDLLVGNGYVTGESKDDL